MTCFRRRLGFAFLNGLLGLTTGVILIAAGGYVLLGSVVLGFTGLWLLNAALISRVCVGEVGIRRVEWLGIRVNDIPFSAIRVLDVSNKPGYWARARVVEIKTEELSFELNLRFYGHGDMRSMLRLMLKYCPEIRISDRARSFAHQNVEVA